MNSERAQDLCFQNLYYDTDASALSQHSTNPSFLTQGAEDFVLTSLCTVRHVFVNGEYTGARKANSETVTFYKNRRNKPGKIIGTPQTVVAADDGSGSFDLPIEPVTFAAQKHYWVSVVVNEHFAVGQWEWAVISRSTYEPAMWRNPDHTVVGSCKRWKPLSTCLGSLPNESLGFSLSQ